MQVATIEFARNVLNLQDANTTEIDPNTENPVIDVMAEPKSLVMKGGTMRLGSYECKLKDNSKAKKAYNNVSTIYERHRHRYEMNNDYRKLVEDAGLVISGVSPDNMLCEIVEYPKNDWFVACQFHPEFKSRPINPHPLFDGLLNAIVKNINKSKKESQICV